MSLRAARLGTASSRAIATLGAWAMLLVEAWVAVAVLALHLKLDLEIPLYGLDPARVVTTVVATLLAVVGALMLPLWVGFPVGLLVPLAAVGTLLSAGLAASDAPPWLVFASVPTVALVVFAWMAARVLPGARTLFGALLPGAAMALAAALAPAMLGFGIGTALLAFRHWDRIAALAAIAIAPPLVAWLGAEIGAASRLNGSRLGGALRDAVFRLAVAGGGVVLAAVAGAAVQAAWTRAFAPTPIAGLALGAGILSAGGALVWAGWAVWRAPRLLQATRFAGRIDGRTVGETLLLPVCAVGGALAAAALLGTGDLVIAGAAWLPAAALYARLRRRSGRPAERAGRTLWLLLPGAERASVTSLAADAAGAWSGGRVVVVALPDAIAEVAGDHAACAAAAGALPTLLPTHPAQLDDWVQALPAPWLSLPVAEVYAPAPLWPTLLRERVDADATILLLGRRAPAPAPAAIAPLVERLPGPLRRAVAAVARTAAARPLTRTEAAAIDPLDAEDPLAADALDREALLGWLKAQQQALPAPALRCIAVVAAAEAAALAEAVAAHLDGATDADGRLVEAVALVEGAAAAPVLAGLPLRGWRFAFRFGARLVERDTRATTLLAGLARAGAAMVGRAGGEFELLRIEADGEAPEPPLSPFYAAGVANGAIVSARVVRNPRNAAAPLPAGFGAQVALPPGRSVDDSAAALAARLLAGDAAAPAPAAPPTVAPPSPITPPPPPPATPEPAAAADPVVLTVGSFLLVCDAAVGESERDALADALRAAQRGADRAAPTQGDWRAWLQHVGDMLQLVGAEGAGGLLVSDGGGVGEVGADPLALLELVTQRLRGAEREAAPPRLLAAAGAAIAEGLRPLDAASPAPALAPRAAVLCWCDDEGGLALVLTSVVLARPQRPRAIVVLSQARDAAAAERLVVALRPAAEAAGATLLRADRAREGGGGLEDVVLEGATDALVLLSDAYLADERCRRDLQRLVDSPGVRLLFVDAGLDPSPKDPLWNRVREFQFLGRLDEIEDQLGRFGSTFLESLRADSRAGEGGEPHCLITRQRGRIDRERLVREAPFLAARLAS